MNMEQAITAAAASTKRQTAQITLERLDAVSRTRALTDVETGQLYNAIKILDRQQPERAYTQWTPALDKRMLKLRAEGKGFTEIAKKFGMTRGAVNSRYVRLREKGLV